MPRVKSHNGCVTCRRRRKKCGEEKPICNHCRRLKLFCTYDGDLRDRRAAAERAASSRAVDQALRLQPQIESFVSIAPESVFIGDFHQLPVPDTQRKEVVELCGRLASTIMKKVWPFSLAQTQLKEVQDGWLGPSFCNGRQLCLSVAALSAGLEAKGDLTSRWQLVRARYESEALSMMRVRLKASQPAVPDFVTLICAAHLPITAISRNITNVQLGKLAAGVRSLLKQFGGVRTFLVAEAHHVVEILVRAEWITCMVLSEASAFLGDFDQPAVPESSLDPTGLVMPCSISTVCDTCLVEIIQSMKVVLHHRVCQAQNNPCSSLHEYYYMTNLLNRISLQLTHMQSAYRHAATTQECVMYALILLRTEVLGHRWMHPRLGDLMSTRFFHAVSKISASSLTETHLLEVMMWVFSTGAVLCHEASAQKHCTDELTIVLLRIFPPEDREAAFDLVTTVETRLWAIAWHASLSRPLRNVLSCEKI